MASLLVAGRGGIGSGAVQHQIRCCDMVKINKPGEDFLQIALPLLAANDRGDFAHVGFDAGDAVRIDFTRFLHSGFELRLRCLSGL